MSELKSQIVEILTSIPNLTLEYEGYRLLNHGGWIIQYPDRGCYDPGSLEQAVEDFLQHLRWKGALEEEIY